MADLTLGELIQIRSRYFRTTLQMWQGKDESPATVTSSINRAKRRIEEELWIYNPKVTLHGHEGVGEYDFEDAGSSTSNNDVSVPVWHPQRAYCNLKELYGADDRPGFWKPQEFLQAVHDWFDTATHGNDVPTIAVFWHIRRVQFFKPFSATAISTGGNYVAGFVRSLDFTLTAPPGDVDDMDQALTIVPRKLQEEVGIFAAILDAHPTLGEREQWAIYKDHRGQTWQDITEQGQANKSQVMNANSVFQPQFSRVERVGFRGW